MVSTIVAIATPVGRSGIGVVRLSGEGSLAIARELIADPQFAPDVRSASLRSLLDPASGEVIDQAVVTYFQAPQSFTGEDVVEISCHGSPVLLRQVVDICLTLGARMAAPGEFTLRALANGRMDLAEAEAIRDLISSHTTAAARLAMRQLRGEFSHQLQPIKDELLDVIVVLESALEFVEDDLPETQSDDIRRRLLALVETVSKLASTFKAGHLLREGIRVAIVGRPNVGKSSLFNALLGTDRAIVTDIAGTTRDQLHEQFSVDGIPVSLIDTAGLRETTDTVEVIGVERSKRTMADADIVIAMLDVSEELASDDIEILEGASASASLVVANKIDKVASEDVAAYIRSVNERLNGRTSPVIATSAKTGEGLDELRHALIQPFAADGVNTEGFLVTDARHHDLLLRTADEIAHSIELLEQRASEELILVGLHNALRYLGQITGETTTEDMLTRIFSTFCIGK